MAQLQGSAVAVRVAPDDAQCIAIDLHTEPPVVTLAEPPAGQGAAHVLAVGQPAEAVLVTNVPLGVRSFRGDDVHLMTLTVMVPGQSPYQAQVGIPVLAAALPLVYPGAKMPVKVVAGEANQITIDWQAGLPAS